MKENGEGVGEVRRSFDHDASLTTGEEEGKEKGSGQINPGLQCSSTKVQPGQWGVLKPKSPRIGVPRFSRKNLHYCSPHGEPSAGSRRRDARP